MTCRQCGRGADLNGTQSHFIGCRAALRRAPAESQVSGLDLRNEGPAPEHDVRNTRHAPEDQCAKGDCEAERAPRGKSGPPPKYCVDHKIKRSKS
jgi:hypothetical protein